MTLYKQPSSFPAIQRARLRYCSTFTTGTLSVISNYRLKANGCFDPNTTGTGHQPYGFDEWSAFYSDYVVLSSRIRATWYTDSSSTQAFCRIGINVVPAAASAPGDIDIGAEQAVVEGVLGGEWDASSGMKTMVAAYDAKKYFHIDDVLDNKTRVGAAVTADPSETVEYLLWADDIAGATYTFGCAYTIEYDVVFSEPKPLGKS
jgi:hypothetical protein